MFLVSALNTLSRTIQKYRDVFHPYRTSLLLGVMALLVTNLLGIAIPWQIKEAVDGLQRIFTPHPPSLGEAWLSLQWRTFYQHLALIAVLAVFVLGARIASRILLLGSGRRMEYDLRNRLYAHFLKMPPAYFSVHPGGELMSRMSNDVDATKMLCGGGVMLGANTLFAYVLTVPFMLAINAPLAGVTFLIYPLVIYGIGRIGKKVRQGFYDVQAVLADISRTAQENLGGMRVIQSYARESQEARRFEGICDRYLGTYNRLIHQRILLFMMLALLSGFSMLAVLLVGGGQVIAKKLDWGGFVAFTLYLEHLAWPTMALGWTLSVFQQGSAALQRIEEVLNTPTDFPPSCVDIQPDDAVKTPQPGALEIRHLTFAYRNPYASADESQPATPVLKDINLRISPGETVALVGSVGSGKSTLLRLLPRLYDVPSGAIFLAGRDITELSLSELRSRVILMPQSSFLFSTTVRRNIAFGLENAQPPTSPDGAEAAMAEPRILDMAEAAGVHLDILNLPRQYDTLVGERGMMLSGGQRQRVALARTLLMDAELLILDDPFSNVDADTEQRIVTALKERQVFRNRTTLITTHRFSIISLCDRVVLMDAGRIAATGTSEELLATQPLYRRLHELQTLRETLGAWDMRPEDALPAFSASGDEV